MDVTYLGNGLRHSAGPILNETKAFLDSDAPDREVEDDLRWESYCRAGRAPSGQLELESMRVLVRDIPSMNCLKCGSQDVGIVYKQGCISPMSGDAYYDVELRCAACGEYSVYSYAEN